MEKFGNDIVELILRRVSDRGDRNSCSEVCKQWTILEGLSRSSLRVLEPERIPSFLPRFPNLTNLDIDRRISDENLKLIAQICPNLRTLNLGLHRSDWLRGFRSRDFGDKGLTAIAEKCRMLEKVSLKRREQVRDAGVIALVKNAKNLAVLDLAWCSKITDEALDAMEGIVSLEVLYLEGCSLITNSGLISLATGSLSKSLRVLDLAECDQITDHGIYFMPQMSCLQVLNLADCGPKITDEGGFAISEIFSLRTLDLSWLINLSDETLVAFAEKCKNLVEISLTGCESVTGEGVRAFANHGSLEMLGLARCSLICTEDIEEIVSRCGSLRHLVLDKVLRGWMSPSAKEKLSMLDRVDWV
ncbi:uncharacterized protein A4U43_C06F12310 [Asparagus officinalis]|uniref:Uncharacterized protein n=1 Tax=Asparagus officinalis TaxID=4686 RepID=A0A5P1EPU2_ASPOF|nr:F-box/LRR-repeat protein 4-like [Asparagus officinalis]ONK66819.1 uncharacterized protein A4U43_C06F12310 [Asparagus officinalis]